MNTENTGQQTPVSKNRKMIAIALLLLAAAAVILCAVYFCFAKKPQEGSKQISIHVIDDTAASVVYVVKTDAQYLRQAMEEADGLTFDGTESEYGMMVDTVNGLTADYDTNGAYWSFYVDGEYCNYGIDQQPIEDGQTYQIIYTAAE